MMSCESSVLCKTQCIPISQCIWMDSRQITMAQFVRKKNVINRLHGCVDEIGWPRRAEQLGSDYLLCIAYLPFFIFVSISHPFLTDCCLLLSCPLYHLITVSTRHRNTSNYGVTIVSDRITTIGIVCNASIVCRSLKSFFTISLSELFHSPWTPTLPLHPRT